MNKKSKSLRRTLSVLLLVIIAVVGLVFLKAKSELNKMHPLETAEVMDRIYAIRNETVNMYLVKDSDTYVAIDAGSDKKGVLVGLKQLGISPDQVKAVLLTHTDFDHVAALSLFPHAKLCFSTDEEQMIDGKTTRTFGLTHNQIDGTKYTLIGDGETFTVGRITVKGIWTPGHTPGSMCYLLNGQYLFVGDACSLKDGKMGPFNDFFNRDSKQAAASMSRITGLPNVKYIFTAHYGYHRYAR